MPSDATDARIHGCEHPVRCCIAPPDLLARVVDEGDADDRAAALRALAASASLRTQRALVGQVVRELQVDARSLGFLPETPGGQRSVYDVRHGGRSALPGTLARGEDDEPVEDTAVNEAFDGAGATYDFYRDVYGRDSLDDKGAKLISSVHYGVGFDNALWNGIQMIYGDGSGRVFVEGAFTRCIDIIGHELTHGVVQYTADLVYSLQPGALNEHFADVFGALVKQYSRKQTAEEADWLIGAGALVPRLGDALRSMKAPGTAFRGDRQPDHMNGYVDLPDDNDPANDNGGVHINSGIPNRAFYLVATKLGGYAWEKAGRIWYVTLSERARTRSQFTDVAQATVEVAGELFGSDEQHTVEEAWREVGVL
jgi:Zn-dependent metalloprotease